MIANSHSTIVKLRDICKIHGGKPAPQVAEAFADQGIPFVRMKDVGRQHQTANLIDIEDSLSEEWAAQNGYLPLPAGCILLPRSGSVALNHRAILGVDAVVVSHLCALEVIKRHRISIPYLYRQLCSISFEKVTRKTTGLDAINFSDLGDVDILLPPLTEQERVAKVIGRADDLQGKCREALNLTDDLLRSVFLDFFGDPVRNSKAWPLTPIANLAKVTTGNTPSREITDYYGDHIEWIKSDNINTPSHYLTKAAEGLSPEGLRVGRSVASGSILITCIAGSPACIGNAALADRPVAFNQQINALTPLEGIESEFLYANVLFSKAKIQAASTQGMKGMVSKGALEQVRFIAPPPPIRKRFAQVFRRVMATTHRHAEAASESEQLFNSLSARAFNSELATP